MKNAVILAAGMGTRLRPITNDKPKCFATVNEMTLIEHALKSLRAINVENITIVIGYMGNKIIKKIGYDFDGMAIKYIENKIYDRTNSMYSLALALEEINDETLILESDVIFDKKILHFQVKNEINWFVDSSVQYVDGSYVRSDKNDLVVKHEIIRNLNLISEIDCKSLGILYCTKEGTIILKRWLKKAVWDGKTNLYYDLILGENINSNKISIIDVRDKKWYEIDNLEDLDRARGVFK